MTSLRDRVEAAASAPPLSELSPPDREELAAELKAAVCFEDLPGRWQAALLEAEMRLAGDAISSHSCH